MDYLATFFYMLRLTSRRQTAINIGVTLQVEGHTHLNRRKYMSNLKSLSTMLDGLFAGTFAASIGLNMSQKFPPCNIQNSDDGKGVLIEVALAGFKKDELNVKREGNILSVEGKSKREPKQGGFQQIAYRDFSRKWSVAPNIKIESVTFEDGLLSILLLHDSPLVEQFEIK